MSYFATYYMKMSNKRYRFVSDGQPPQDSEYVEAIKWTRFNTPMVIDWLQHITEKSSTPSDFKRAELCIDQPENWLLPHLTLKIKTVNQEYDVREGAYIVRYSNGDLTILNQSFFEDEPLVYSEVRLPQGG
jgi:hypothetical protein